jgi:filamentous hemagglutinin
VFRGPGERINLAPMDFNLNRGAWKIMENEWSAALRAGKEVRVVIDVKYPPGSQRPDRFIVKYQIGDDPPEREIFKNAPGGR